MPVLDVLVAVGVLAAIFAIVLGLAAWRGSQSEIKVKERNDRDQQTGKYNVVALQYEQARICHYCAQMTDPRHDLFLDNLWVHTACFMKFQSKAKAQG